MDVTSVYSFSELMIYIAISGIIFGVGSAISAANKGRSIFLWFLIGFLIGPFGFTKNRDRPRLISPNMVLQPKLVSLSLNRLG